MTLRRAAVAVAALCGHAGAAPAKLATTTTHPGITHETWSDPAIPARIHVVRVDLTSQELALYATKESDRGLTTTGFSDRIGAAVAVNGDAFAVSGYLPRGLAIGDSTPWTNTADDATSALFHLRRVADGSHERTAAAIVTPEVVTTPEMLPEGTQGAIAGRPLLIRAGVVEPSFSCTDPITIACQRAPRTAIAISADGNTLWLVVVNGWQQGSIGMTAAELAGFLRTTYGPHMAMVLDSGSSSTLVLDGALANTPSDGVERTVANHLAVKFGALPRGQLVGLVCRDDIIACRDDDSLRLPGAQVTLDDGRVDVVGSDAFYDFTNITPRLACVTVKKTGFKSKRQCQIVDSGTLSFNSVALEQGVDLPDAGATDAGPGIDAGDLLDGGFVPDGGNPEIGEGGGCCDAGRKAPERQFFLAVLVGFLLVRRRGTTVGR